MKYFDKIVESIENDDFKSIEKVEKEILVEGILSNITTGVKNVGEWILKLVATFASIFKPIDSKRKEELTNSAQPDYLKTIVETYNKTYTNAIDLPASCILETKANILNQISFKMTKFKWDKIDAAAAKDDNTIKEVLRKQFENFLSVSEYNRISIADLVISKINLVTTDESSSAEGDIIIKWSASTASITAAVKEGYGSLDSLNLDANNNEDKIIMNVVDIKQQSPLIPIPIKVKSPIDNTIVNIEDLIPGFFTKQRLNNKDFIALEMESKSLFALFSPTKPISGEYITSNILEKIYTALLQKVNSDIQFSTNNKFRCDALSIDPKIINQTIDINKNAFFIPLVLSRN